MIRAEDITQLPSCSYTSQKNPREGSSWIITSTPYKDELERSIAEQERRGGTRNKQQGKSSQQKETPHHKKQKKKLNRVVVTLQILLMTLIWMMFLIWI